MKAFAKMTVQKERPRRSSLASMGSMDHEAMVQVLTFSSGVIMTTRAIRGLSEGLSELLEG